MHRNALIALIVANTVWGAAAPIYKWALEGVEPFTLGFFRFALSSLILLWFVRKSLFVEKRDRIKLIILATLLSIHIGLLNLSLLYTNSINVPIIGSSAPLFLIIGSIFILKTSVSLKKIIGAIVGFCGVLIILVFPSLQSGFDGMLLGNSMLIISTLGSVIYTILIKEIISRYNPLTLVFWTFVIATILFFPFVLYEAINLNSLQTISLQGLTGIMYATLGSSILAYFCYYFAIKYLEVSDIGVFTYIDPVIAVLIAVPLLGEKLTGEYLFGSFLVFLGIYIAENRLHYHPFGKLKK